MGAVVMSDPQRPTAGRRTSGPALNKVLDAAATSTPRATATQARPARPVTSRVDPVLRVQTNLTARDHTIIAWLGDHGVLTTDQVAFALFPSVDFAQRRLRVLTELGLVQRFRPLKLDGGSYPFHYVLDHLGALVLAVQTGAEAPRPAQSRARMQVLTRRPDLGHLLGVNQFFTDLAGTPAPTPVPSCAAGGRPPAAWSTEPSPPIPTTGTNARTAPRSAPTPTASSPTTAPTTPTIPRAHSR
jgi:predicted transcriptional regulator